MAERRAALRCGVVTAAALVLAVAFVLGLLDVRRRALNSDFTVFTIASAAFFDGRDPYAISNPQGWHYAYPPIFALAVAPLSRLGFRGQVGAWYAISVGLGLLSILECRRIASAVREAEPGPASAPIPRAIVLAAIVSAVLPALDTLQRGQVAMVLIWPLLLGLRLYLEARAWPAGIALSLPIAIKLTPLIPVGLLVLVALRSDSAGREPSAARWPAGLTLAAGVGLGLALFLFALPSAVIGWSANAAHLATWARRIQASAQVGVDDNKFTFRNQSLENAVEMLARWEHPRSPLRWTSPRDPAIRDLRAAPRVPRALIRAGVPAIQALLAALAVAAAWRIGGRRRPLGTAAVFGLGGMLSLVLSPISWAHHFVIGLPGVLFVPWWLWCRGRPAAAWWLAVAPATMVALHYFLIDTGWIERPFGHALSLMWVVGLLGVGTAVWCGTASALMLFAPTDRER